MSSTAASAAAAGDVLPSLPPIRTAAPSPRQEPEDHRARSSEPAASSSSDNKCDEAAAAGGQEAAAEEPTTPTWKESRLQPPIECPPAPRKPAWAQPPPAPAKRKFLPSTSPSSSPRRPAFFPVARDLSTVFRALPPKKRIRAG